MSPPLLVQVRRGLVLLPILLLPTTALRAQSPAAAAPAEAITAAELARHLAALPPAVAPSLSGPALDRAAQLDQAAQLERTAQSVATAFAADGGLLPGARIPRPPRWGNRDTMWIQRFPYPGQVRVDYGASRVTFVATLQRQGAKLLSERGTELTRSVRASFASTARFAGPADTLLPHDDLEDSRPMVLLAGRHTAASVQTADIDGKIVLYVPPADADSTALRVQQVLAARSHGLIMLRATDSLQFAAAVQAAPAGPARLADVYLFEARLDSWVIEVWPELLRGVLATAGVDLSAARAQSAPLVQPLPALRVEYDVRAAEPTPAEDSARVELPNVLATVEGRDSVLKQEYILVVADLDEPAPMGAPAAGVAALLELAKAFGQPGARPARSMVFLAASSGGRGFWGSRYFLTRQFPRCVLVTTLDQLGAAAGDSLWLDGARELELGRQPAWVAALHPELGLTMVDTGSVFASTGEHTVFSKIPFTRNGIPTLHAHGRPGPADPEVLAREVRLLYHVMAPMAEVPAKPSWNPTGRSAAGRARAAAPKATP